MAKYSRDKISSLLPHHPVQQEQQIKRTRSEVFLVSGNPATTPQLNQSGAIWFMTNNAMIGNRAQLDLAFATFDTHTSSVTVVPDQRLSAVGVNAFNIIYSEPKSTWYRHLFRFHLYR